MRSALGKECRKLFRKLMAVEFPDYKEAKGLVVPQGWYGWRYQHPSGLFFWIFLVIFDSRDEFTTEAGWSFDANKPPWTGISSHEAKEVILSKPLAFRTCRLWCNDNWGYTWKLVLRLEEYGRVLLYKDDPVEDCLPLIAPAVWEAGEKLKEHVLPVFGEIVRKQGSSPQKQF